MRVNFLVNEVFNGWEPTDTRLGGTEESVVRWAEELAKRGHKVQVFRNPTQWLAPTEYNLVAYAPREMYKGNGDICINIKSSEVAPKEPTLYLTNETNADQLDLSKYLGVIWPSQWCVDNIPVNNTTFVLPHGYDSSKIYPSEKFSKQCLYASSPDRGLETLLKVWPDVYKNHPDASLIVTYGAEPQDIPGVMFLGETDEETMNELYKTSDFWTHPCSGGELFGITGIKAQASGCIPVIIPTMALKETVPTGYLAQSVDDYADTLEWALESSTEEKALMRETLAQNHYVDWYESTELLLNIIESVIIN